MRIDDERRRHRRDAAELRLERARRHHDRIVHAKARGKRLRRPRPDSRRLTARRSRAGRRSAPGAPTSIGISSRHGPHQVAQKFSSTTLPASEAFVMARPSRSVEVERRASARAGPRAGSRRRAPTTASGTPPSSVRGTPDRRARRPSATAPAPTPSATSAVPSPCSRSHDMPWAQIASPDEPASPEP